ncbi:MAG TPA: hypothetical protein VFS94_00140 [Gemmatimonadales bacterium]|nr:hypothetical protein [Gemmatimonadales bacterium]
MELKSALFGVIIFALLVNGIATRWGTWSAKAWAVFAVRITVAAVLAGTAYWMATRVDAGLTRSWSAAARTGWVLAMVASGFTGVIFGMSTLFNFGTDEPESERRSMLRIGLGVVMGLVASMALAISLEAERGIPLRQSFTMLAGLALLGLGTWGPAWLIHDPRSEWLTRALGSWAVRALFIGLGVLLVIAAVVTDGISRP